MTDKVRRVDFYPDEYLTGIAGVMNAAEQGVYWMICSLIMSEGKPIDFNERRFATYAMMRPNDVRKIVSKLIDLGKLDLTDDGKLAQKRSLNEIKRAAKRIQTASENGSKGGRPARKDQQNQQNEKAAGSFSEKLTPTTTPTEERETNVSPKKSGRLRDGESELREVLDDVRARAVVDHRLKLRKPLTPRAAALLAQAFAECEDPNAAADVMVANGWQGFKRAWLDRVNTPNPNQRQALPPGRKESAADMLNRMIEEAEHEPNAESQGIAAPAQQHALPSPRRRES